MNDTIKIKGARENNLKNVDLTIPRDKLVVFTGLSVCFGLGLVFPIAPNAERKSAGRQSTKLWIELKTWERGHGLLSFPRSFVEKRENMPRFLRMQENPALPVSVWMAFYMT